MGTPPGSRSRVHAVAEGVLGRCGQEAPGTCGKPARGQVGVSQRSWGSRAGGGAPRLLLPPPSALGLPQELWLGGGVPLAPGTRPLRCCLDGLGLGRGGTRGRERTEPWGGISWGSGATLSWEGLSGRRVGLSWAAVSCRSLASPSWPRRLSPARGQGCPPVLCSLGMVYLFLKILEWKWVGRGLCWVRGHVYFAREGGGAQVVTPSQGASQLLGPDSTGSPAVGSRCCLLPGPLCLSPCLAGGRPWPATAAPLTLAPLALCSCVASVLPASGSGACRACGHPRGALWGESGPATSALGPLGPAAWCPGWLVRAQGFCGGPEFPGPGVPSEGFWLTCD